MDAVAFEPLLPLPLIAASPRRAPRHRARALARADRLVAARPRGARAARRARRPLAAPRGPDAGAEHRHRRRRRQRLEPHRRPRRPARSGARRPAGPARPPRPGRRLEVRTVHVADRGEDGTQLLTALAEATAELPADRIAGAILVTDGQIHDPQALATFPGPVQVLLTGSAERLGPPRRGRDRAGLRHRRRAGQPRPPRRGHRRRARRRRLRAAVDLARRHRAAALRRAARTERHPAGHAAARRRQRAPDRHPGRRGRAHRPQQPGDRLDQRRPRPAARAARLRRALSRRADVAEPAEVRLRGRPRRTSPSCGRRRSRTSSRSSSSR